MSLRFLFLLSALAVFLQKGFAQTQDSITPHYRNLILEGGGIRGIAYCGALEALEEKGILNNIRRVGGTSAGAIQATLLAVNYSAAEITDVVAGMKIQSFNDGQFLFVGGTHRLIERFGWYKGDVFRRWLGNKISAKVGKSDLTFGELHQLAQRDSCIKDLYVTATNLTQQKVMVFSYENHPNLAIADAVRASMSIPLYYCAVFMDSTGRFYKNPPVNTAADVLVDGGVLMNFPIDIFDQNQYLESPLGHFPPSTKIFNPTTLGLRLERSEQIKADAQNMGLASYSIRDFRSYLGAFYNLVSEVNNRNNFSSADLKRTISIDFQHIGARVRKISEEEKQTLINNGKKAVEVFFSPSPSR